MKSMTCMTWSSLLILISIFLSLGCAKKVLITTGTTLGLSASPGDGQSRPPKITLAYKRAETAIIPTGGKRAVLNEKKPSKDSDAFSTLAVFFFSTQWFGKTELESFISTGHASRLLISDENQGTEFTESFAAATLGVVSQSIQERRKALNKKRKELTEQEAIEVLTKAGFTHDSNKNALQELQDKILKAQTDASLKKLEAAFKQVP